MNRYSNYPPDQLPEAVAARVLERAAQLDTAAARNVSLADLRTAAQGAGITEAALNQALHELATEALSQGAAASRPAVRRLPQKLAVLAGGAALVIAAMLAGSRLIPPPSPAPLPEIIVEVEGGRERIVVPPR